MLSDDQIKAIIGKHVKRSLPLEVLDALREVEAAARREVEAAARREAHDDFWIRTVTTAYEQGYGYGLEERGADRNPYSTECPGHRAWAIGYETGAERRVAELERTASIRRDALKEAAKVCRLLPSLHAPMFEQHIRALMETPQGVSTQPAPSEPHHIPDATKMVSDALPELPDDMLNQPAEFKEIGVKWIRYAQTDCDTNDIATAVWAAIAETRAALANESEQLAQSADARDAARYRWLRKRVGVYPDKYHGVWMPVGSSKITDEDEKVTDAAIDAAMQGKESEK